MRGYLFILFLVYSLTGFAQVDSIGLKAAIQELDKALLQKDEAILGSVLHHDVSYGHSNGWLQNKQEVSNDLKSGKMVYNTIVNGSMRIEAIDNDRATVRITTEAGGIVNGTAFQLKLQVLQVWVRIKSGWQLLARQSVKLN